jgi:acetyl esterase/lipase
MHQSRVRLWAAGAAVAALALSGCGGGGSSSTSANTGTTEGTLTYNPPLRVAHLTAADLTANLNASTAGQQLLAVAGAPTCGVDVHYIQYQTVGGAGEAATATGALMVPNGTSAPCGGARPIVLYAHGTTTEKAYNIANIVDTTNAGNAESALIAAMFAAQGYIVVAPNYAGYDTSSLSYHPYLNADQQSKDMIDALTAARSALGQIPASGTTDNGKLFITGYSQGGHVALATQRALQVQGKTVTAVAGMSGPYALEAFADAIFYGNVDLGSTEFAPLLVTSYQHSYGNIYAQTTDIYTSTYATGIDTLMPSQSFSAMVSAGKLPLTALFSLTAPTTGGANPTLDAMFPAITPPTTPAAQAPLFALGFANSNFLINNNYRLAYIIDTALHPDGVVPAVTNGMPATSPANTLRQALKANDLRGFVPTSPVLMCGGSSDPTVFYSVNTGTMQTLWSGLGPLVTTVDLEATPASPFTAAQAGFQAAKTAVGAAGGTTAVMQEYHAVLVPPFCTAVARGFFSNF